MRGEDIWCRPDVIAQSARLISSYRNCVGRDLIATSGDETANAKALFLAPFALLSHGTQDDPVLNYGNQTALTLWEMDFARFTQMPSRLTAEPMLREERQRLLETAARKGYIDDYAGIRISAAGQRFRISNVILWTVTDAQGAKSGQAAVFDTWDKV
jgi:hypothetical protein